MQCLSSLLLLNIPYQLRASCYRHFVFNMIFAILSVFNELARNPPLPPPLKKKVIAMTHYNKMSCWPGRFLVYFVLHVKPVHAITPQAEDGQLEISRWSMAVWWPWAELPDVVASLGAIMTKFVETPVSKNTHTHAQVYVCIHSLAKQYNKWLSYYVVAYKNTKA